MEYTRFKEELVNSMKERLGDAGEVSVITIQKNNTGDTESLVIRLHGQNASPAIRLRACYDAFLEGIGMEELLDRLMLCVQQAAPECIQKLDLEEYESIRKQIFMRLVNSASNACMLGKRPYREFKDLAVIYQIYLDEEGNGTYSTAITNHMLKVWNVTEDDLFRQAWENQNRCGDYVLVPIENMLFQLLESGSPVDQDIPVDARMPFGPETGLLVLTNTHNMYGAVQLLNDEALREASCILGGDYWIFPSSVHELILASADLDKSRTELEEMVREINATQLEPEEVLSDRIYYYEHTSGILC